MTDKLHDSNNTKFCTVYNNIFVGACVRAGPHKGATISAVTILALINRNYNRMACI